VNKDEKARLRKVLLQRRASLSPEERKKKGEKIRDNFFSLPFYKKSKTIMFYLSLPTEVPTDEMIERALSEGKRIAVPCIKEGNIFPSLLISLSQTEVGRFGIREPKKKKFISPKELGLVVVPGCGFDLKGHRIGFGKGFYDRFLSELKENIPLVALAFEIQIVEEIPSDRWDVQMNYIVTERRIIKIKI
jgi:5-formyltetrahydrofolate cyclo-ligase